jgi:hypothetical protein
LKNWPDSRDYIAETGNYSFKLTHRHLSLCGVNKKGKKTHFPAAQIRSTNIVYYYHHRQHHHLHHHHTFCEQTVTFA